MAPGAGAGAGAPEGAGGGAPPPGAQIGAAGPTQITPQMAQMAQLVQRLLVQQKGTDYAKKMLRQLGLMVKGAMNSQFMQNPPAESDLADAFKKINSAVDKLDRNSGTGAPALQSMVADLMVSDAAKPPGEASPTPPAFPMSQ